MRVPDRTSQVDRVLLVLIAITAVALALRLYDIGGRMAHWDEGRVAFDTLRYTETGVWRFRPVVHGPFLPKVNRVVFEVLGPSDASMRLVVAVIGGLAPLTAWLYRRHLDRAELVVLGLLLASNPVLLYYSRFMRNDVMLAVVMFAAFGLHVRAHDTGSPAYVYPAAALIALGFAMKGNALLYPLVWIGALAVVVDQRALVRAGTDGSPGRYLLETGRSAVDDLRDWWPHAFGASLLGLAILVGFYLPRGEGTLSLTDVALAPWRLPELLDVSVVDATERMLGYWLTAGGDTPYLSFLGHYVETLWVGAAPIVVFAVLGFLVDRYRQNGSRTLVTVAFLWGFVSVLGYPIAADIRAAWLAAHAIVPLAIPASVGIAILVRAGWDTVTRADGYSPDVVVVGLVVGAILIVTTLAVAVPAVDLVYLNPTEPDNQLVQYAQPEGDWDDTIEVMHELAERHDGVDVFFVGDSFHMSDEADADILPATSGWYDRLPLPWYIAQVGGTTASEIYEEPIAEVMEREEPPVVIVREHERSRVAGHVDGYEERSHRLRQRDYRLRVYLDLDRLDDANP